MAINSLNTLGISFPGLQIPGQSGIAPAAKSNGEGGLGGVATRTLNDPTSDSAPAPRRGGLDGLRAESQSIASSQGLFSVTRSVLDTLSATLNRGREIAEETQVSGEAKPSLANEWEALLEKLETAFGNAEIGGVNLFRFQEDQVALSVPTENGAVEVSGLRQVVEISAQLFNAKPATPDAVGEAQQTFTRVELSISVSITKFESVQGELSAAQSNVTNRMEDAIKAIFGDLFDESLADNPFALAGNAARGLFGQSNGIANANPTSVNQLYAGAGA